MKEWHFYDRVYRSWVVVVIGTAEEFIKFMDGTTYKYCEDLQPNSSGYCITLNGDNTTNGNYATIIWLKRKEYACLVHELSHLVMQIFDDKGVPLRNENTEAFAYYIEFWFNTITRAWRSSPGGIKSSEVIK